MRTPRARAAGRGHAARHAVALVTALTLGCTTVRAPVSGIDPTVPIRGSAADPQVELWLESAADPTPAESARAVADAREALRRALQDRSLWDDAVLVVRAQAVSRTSSRRANQNAAIAGIAVGTVAIIALAVIVSRGHGGVPAHGGGGAAHAASGFRPGVPHAAGGSHPWVPPPRPPLAPVAARPHPAPSRGGVDVNVDVAVAEPAPPDAGPASGAYAAEPPASPYAASGWPAEERARLSAVTLPAPSPLSVRDRGFFDGDWVRLELVVVDARSGAVWWTKTVTEDVDVRDAREVRRILDDALATEDGWTTPYPVAP